MTNLTDKPDAYSIIAAAENANTPQYRCISCNSDNVRESKSSVHDIVCMDCWITSSKADALKNPHAVALGRLGGAAGKGVTSERKAASSRANMQKAAQASAAKKRAKKANPRP